MLRSLGSIFCLVGFALDVSLNFPQTQESCLPLPTVVQEPGQSSHCERDQSLPSLPLQSRMTWFSGAGFLPYSHLEYLKKHGGNFYMADVYMAEGFAYRALETLQLA